MDSFSSMRKIMGNSDSFQYSQMMGGEAGSSIDEGFDSQIQHPPLPKLKAFYARISAQNVEQQLWVYKWRQEQKDHIIPVFSYQVLSSGSIFNPNPLIKIILPEYQSNFKELPKLSLSQTLVLAKSIIRSLTILYQRFSYICLKQKMIVLDQDNKIRIWPVEDYYINPDNTIYYSLPKHTQKQSIKSVTKILKRKCLKSVLSEQFFTDISTKNTFEQVYNLIIKYEDNKKLIVPKIILPTFSSPNLHRVTSSERILVKSTFKESLSSKALISCSLKNTIKFFLSDEEKEPQKKKQAKKQKIQSVSVKRQDIKPFKNSNMTRAHSGFISFTPQDKEYLNKNMRQLLKDSDICQENVEGQKSFHNEESFTPLLEKGSKKLSLKSCVISEIFNPELKDTKEEPKNYQWNVLKVEREDQQYSDIQEEILYDYEPISPNVPEPPTPKVSQEDSLFRSEEIFAMNGWNNVFTLPLKTTKNMKQSYSYGVEEESHLKGRKLNKLHTMGRLMTQSFLPVEEQDINEDY